MVGGWCGTVIIVSALSLSLRDKERLRWIEIGRDNKERKRELDNNVSQESTVSA